MARTRRNRQAVPPQVEPPARIEPPAPIERAAAILAQVDWEIALIKERDHHWEDGMEVSCLPAAILDFTHLQLERISAPACDPSSTTLQVVLTT